MLDNNKIPASHAGNYMLFACHQTLSVCKGYSSLVGHKEGAARKNNAKGYTLRRKGVIVIKFFLY